MLPQAFPRTDIVVFGSYFKSSINFIGDSIFRILVLSRNQKCAALRLGKMMSQGCLICESFLAAETGNETFGPLMGSLDVPSTMCESMK